MVTVSVPGKIHLLGEHAIVYGKPALLAAINRRLTVSVEAAENEGEIISDEPTSYVQHALETTCHHYSIHPIPTLKITVSSQFLPGYHLGSSAAVAVGCVGAVSYFLKKIWNPTVINQIAYEVEKKQHGNPSGGDNTIVTFGGLVWYRKETEFLRSIWQLPFQLPESLNHFYLLNTGRPHETTGEMISALRVLYTNRKKFVSSLLEKNEQSVKDIATAVKNAKEPLLIQALHEGERTLESMGVVSPMVRPSIRAIEKAGGAAKILGGGGKSGPVGYLLCYHPHKEILGKVVSRYGFPLEAIRLGEEGIRLESGKPS